MPVPATAHSRLHRDPKYSAYRLQRLRPHGSHSVDYSCFLHSKPRHCNAALLTPAPSLPHICGLRGLYKRYDYALPRRRVLPTIGSRTSPPAACCSTLASMELRSRTRCTRVCHSVLRESKRAAAEEEHDSGGLYTKPAMNEGDGTRGSICMHA